MKPISPWPLWLLVAVLGFMGCGAETASPPQPADTAEQPNQTQSADQTDAGSPSGQPAADFHQPAEGKGAESQANVSQKGDQPMKIEITSSAFSEGKPIPKQYTGEGKDVSPPLRWSGVPEETRELALICDDPDAPSRKKPGPKPWVHWLIYKIPADTTALPEGVPAKEKLDEPAGALQGNNSWPKIGYNGPMPPPGSGAHRYYFKLYALDRELDLGPGKDKEALLQVMSGHIVGEGQLMGTYER